VTPADGREAGDPSEAPGPEAQTGGRRPRRLRRVTRLAIWAAAASLAVPVVLIGGSNLWIRVAARPHLHAELDALPTRTAAIVLGAAVYGDGTPSAILEDRLHAALTLYRAGKVRRILVSGDHGQRHYDEVGAMHRWLLAHGVPSEDVFLDHAGFRTLDTMERAARVFQVKDAIVCTQAFHLPRAVFLARRAGIDAVGFEADRRTYPGAPHDRRRETLAVALAFVDSYVLRRGPRVLGPSHPIDGDAAATHGR
jgi:SanA protein